MNIPACLEKKLYAVGLEAKNIECVLPFTTERIMHYEFHICVLNHRPQLSKSCSLIAAFQHKNSMLIVDKNYFYFQKFGSSERKIRQSARGGALD